MIDGRNVIALIPARGGSKGLPRKNILEMGGLPLIGYTIKAAGDAECIDRVVVSTDDTETAGIAINLGANLITRPDELATDYTPMIDVISHAIDCEAREGRRHEYLVLLQPTSPLTGADDIDAAMKMLVNTPGADAVVSVNKTNAYLDVTLDDGYVRSSRGDSRRQDMDIAYRRNGALFISSIDTLLKTGTFCHTRTLGYEVPKHKAFEVDDIVDFVCIEAIMGNMG